MTIIVCGQNDKNQLFAKPNTHNENEIPCICPPLKISEISWDNIKSFSIGQSHSVFITNDGKAFCIGSDEKYQIGTKSRDIYSEITEIQIDGFEGKKFIFGKCGKNYTIYLTEEKDLLLCCNKCENYKPLLIRFLQEDNKSIIENFSIKYFKVGKTRIGVVDDKDNFYLIEKKNLPKIEEGNIIKIKKVPHPIVEGIIDICICEEFVCLLSSSGRVYGNGELNKNKATFMPILMPRKVNVRKIEGTHFHCFAIGENGEIFVYSYNGSGQLGLGHKDDTTKFEELTFFLENHIKITNVATSGFHSVFITDKNAVYTCGNNFNGQLLHKGIFNDERNLTPIEVINPLIQEHKIHSVYCGEYSTVIFIE